MTRAARSTAEAALLAALLLAACSSLPRSEPILHQPDGVTVFRVTGEAPAKPPEGQGPLTHGQIADSLRRITVRYHGLVSWVKRDPQPLLSPEQAEDFATILERELPGLKPDQRIRIEFKDAKRKKLNDVSVYRSGAYLVYDFAFLVADPMLAVGPTDPPRSDASVFALPGQVVEDVQNPRALIEDPVSGSQLTAAQELSEALAMIQGALQKQVIDDVEAGRLKQVAQDHPATPAAEWRRYWDKRGTLKDARDKTLVDPANYTQQLQKLERELIGTAPGGATPQK